MDSQDDVTRTLERLLTAPPEGRSVLAPKVAAVLGEQEFHRVFDRTERQIGVFAGVEDTPDGLVIRGSRGTATAWGVTDADGTLAAFRIGGPYEAPSGRSARRPSRSISMLNMALRSALVVALFAQSCWAAGTVVSWAANLLAMALLFVAAEGLLPIAVFPGWIRRSLEAGALAALVAAYRVPSLPEGGWMAVPVVLGVVLLASVGLLVRARRHRWGTPLSAPLAFPFDTGTWVVTQGGGRGINHHVPAPEQRGALDLCRVGPVGRRLWIAADDLEAFASYGTPLLSPCDGVVVRALDGLRDQPLKRLRFSHLYGNHVSIDTGHEVVHLAHLRNGSVKVAVGDTVTAGQLLGEVGNSGNTTAPHLHIHAERDGLGLDLAFTGVRGTLHRGRTIRTSA
jgi:hypothetical protein